MSNLIKKDKKLTKIATSRIKTRMMKASDNDKNDKDDDDKEKRLKQTEYLSIIINRFLFTFIFVYFYFYFGADWFTIARKCLLFIFPYG